MDDQRTDRAGCSVSAVEVAELLRNVVLGRQKIQLASKDIPWTAPDRASACTNVPFVVDGWIIVLVNNMMSLNHVESATAPDGRQSNSDDWPQNPQGLMSWSEISALDQKLEKDFPTT
jgi:hypothetical protein